MSVNWHRAVWQYRANVGAEVARCLCIVLLADEALWAIKYHFPGWDDILIVATMVIMQASWFVDHYTRMYRFDLD